MHHVQVSLIAEILKKYGMKLNAYTSYFDKQFKY